MAVEVENREPDPSVVRRIVCRRCGVGIRYLPRDVQERKHREIDGGLDTYRWIWCPECESKITVR